MSNMKRLENTGQLIQKLKPNFDRLVGATNPVKFEQEASWAMLSLKGNDYLAGIAYSNLDSLKEAVLMVASTGLSLNPIKKQAYLVPDNKAVRLWISYQGFRHSAMESEAILWAQAEIVYERDKFELQGIDKEPYHFRDPFRDRGEKVGAYCTAKLPNGDFLTESMGIGEIFGIRNRSRAWKAWLSKKKKNPWVTDEDEMIRKTVIKRAAKSWPIKENRRMESVLQIEDEQDRELKDVTPTDLNDEEREAKYEAVRDQLEVLGRTEEKYLAHLVRVFSREIAVLEDLTDIELDQCIAMLQQFIDQKEKRETQSEVS